MSLLALQTAFHAELIAADDAAEPSSPGIAIGMAIYRDAYRGRLLAALEASFERTRRWVGAEVFTQAACHYILTRPPSHWTLDVYGDAFPALLAQLFAEDPEVAELAWLEWQLQGAFAAPDRPELVPSALAAVGFWAEEWAAVGFAMAAGFAMRPVQTDCGGLWQALAGDEPGAEAAECAARRQAGRSLIVWRAGLSPHWRLVEADEAQVLDAIACREPLGAMAALADESRLGPWLAGWLREGLLSAATLRN